MILPTVDHRRTSLVIPEKLYEGCDAAMHGVIGQRKRASKHLKLYMEMAEDIHHNADKFKTISAHELRQGLAEMRNHFRRQKKGYEHCLPDALSLLVETAHRTLGLRPYPVQIAGAIALYKGYLVEMATGEGKSLTACLPAIIAAWTERPCHIVTVNDYLASRDAIEMEPLYHLCDVSVGCVTSAMEPSDRRFNYAKGIVYTTSKELVADFLRDRLLIGSLHHASRRLIHTLLSRNKAGVTSDNLVMRGIDTAIVDEADSVLIDEAVTPLIISRLQENKPFSEASITASSIAGDFIPEVDYHTDIKYKDIRFTRAGYQKMEDMAHHLQGIWRSPSRMEELITQALTAREFYHRDVHYVIHEGKVIIVDEFTGRLMPNRTWRQGLHQAIEAKESLELTNPSETLSRISFQQFFRLFRKLSGMTGTAREAAREFWHIYSLPIITIPTNRPSIRKVSPDKVFGNEEHKWEAILEEIRDIHTTGRPILAGTRSISASEKLAAMLSTEGLEFNLLNAIYHEQEAKIVEAAGELGRITIATNMAGRGTDIKLGRKVAELGGLHVIATERHESGRIDRQLFGRSARQGDPGSARAFISIEDELLRRFIPQPFRSALGSSVQHKRPGAHQMAKGTVEIAQFAAQRLAFHQRKSVLKMDTWLEEALSFSGRGFK